MEVRETMELVVEKRYLNLPVKNGAAKRRMKVLLDGETVREFEIELAEGKPDFWVFLDLAPFTGKTLALQLDGGDAGAEGMASITQDDEIKGAENLYAEKHRSQFHFSSRRGWNNDPNGLVYYKGEYHLYYQHNPYGWKWGNMHWGHAVSEDLVHWRELPIALYPHRFDDWCFSGSAAVDWANTAGFRTGDDDVIVAAYTSTGRGESIAYSNDRGRTFTDYEGNPVVRHSGRDPKIIRHAPTGQWVMAVFDEYEEKGWIAFYTSPDLKTWEFQSRIEGYHECPELFELPVDGDAGNTRWVAYAGDGNYVIGRFDGRTFTIESGKHQGHYGNCFYASQTFTDIPADDGRRIQIGWGQVNTPGMPFNQMMTFPCELALRTTAEGIRMFTRPVEEIETLHGTRHAWTDEEIRPDVNLLAGVTGELFDIRAEFAVGDAAELGFVIRGVPVTCDVAAKTLRCKDKAGPLPPIDGKIRLQILVDRTSIEIYGNDGQTYMPIGGVLPEANKTLALTAKGGAATAKALEVHELRSAWEPR